MLYFFNFCANGFHYFLMFRSLSEHLASDLTRKYEYVLYIILVLYRMRIPMSIPNTSDLIEFNWVYFI